jgi:hypothetical protein
MVLGGLPCVFATQPLCVYHFGEKVAYSDYKVENNDLIRGIMISMLIFNHVMIISLKYVMKIGSGAKLVITSSALMRK